MPPAESDRRDYPRLKKSVSVRYKFLSSTVKDPAMERICDGVTQNISMGGLLLVGPVPRLDWLKDLLLGRINIGVNLVVPAQVYPIKVLTRVAWLEATDEQAMNMRIGLRILEVPPDQRKALSDFLTMETAAT
jgi:hypothetical protein